MEICPQFLTYRIGRQTNRLPWWR